MGRLRRNHTRPLSRAGRRARELDQGTISSSHQCCLAGLSFSNHSCVHGLGDGIGFSLCERPGGDCRIELRCQGSSPFGLVRSPVPSVPATFRRGWLGGSGGRTRGAGRRIGCGGDPCKTQSANQRQGCGGNSQGRCLFDSHECSLLWPPAAVPSVGPACSAGCLRRCSLLICRECSPAINQL